MKLRQLVINNPPILQRIFVCLRSCCVENIAIYVTEATSPKTDKKASKVGGLFVSSCLKSTPLLIALLMASCTLFTPNKDSQPAVKQAIKTPESWAMKAEQYGDDSTQWLETFNDPMMLKLIEEGKANNFDLQVAAGNMDKAWLLAKQSGAALKPNADLSMGRAPEFNS